MQPLGDETEKNAAPPSLFSIHRKVLELQSEFTTLLTMEPYRKAGECDALAKTLRQHLYATKVHLLCTNVQGALNEIKLVRTGLGKLKSFLLAAPMRERR